MTIVSEGTTRGYINNVRQRCIVADHDTCWDTALLSGDLNGVKAHRAACKLSTLQVLKVVCLPTSVQFGKMALALLAW